MGTTQEGILELADGERPLAARTIASEARETTLATTPQEHDLTGDDLAMVFRSGSDRIKELTNALGQYCHSKDLKQKASVLAEMHGHLRQLRSEFTAAHLGILGAFCGCLGRLLSSLGSNTEAANPSKLRTISNAIDFLRITLGSQLDCREVEKTPLRAMVVDDDPVCRRAMLLALTSGELKSLICESGEQALEQLNKDRVDVIFTDIMMPGLNGYELARKIRELPGCWSTPIVFVTSLSDFDARSKSILSGGCELIAKPITASELVVKAFTFALRYRMTAEELSPARISTAPRRSAAANHLGVVCVQPEGTIQKLNQEAALLLGYAPDELPGRAFADMFPEDLQTANDSVTIRALFAGEYKTRRGVKMVGRRKDRTLGNFAVTISEPLSSESSGFIVFLRRLDSIAETPKPPELALKMAGTAAVDDASPDSPVDPQHVETIIPAGPTSPGANGNGSGVATSEAEVRPAQKVAELERFNRDAREQLQLLTGSEAELRKRYESLQSELADAKQRLEETRCKLDVEAFARVAAEKQSAELSARRARLEEALAHQGRTHQETISRLEQTQARLQKTADLQARLDAAERQASALQVASVQAEQQSTHFESELETVSKREIELQTKCVSLDEELKASNQLLAEAQQRINDHTALEARAAALQGELQHLTEAHELECVSERASAELAARERATAEQSKALLIELENELANAQRHLEHEREEHSRTQQRLSDLAAAAEGERAGAAARERISAEETKALREELGQALAQAQGQLHQEHEQHNATLQRLTELETAAEQERGVSAERERLASQEAATLRENLNKALEQTRRQLDGEREQHGLMQQRLTDLAAAAEGERAEAATRERISAEETKALREELGQALAQAQGQLHQERERHNAALQRLRELETTAEQERATWKSQASQIESAARENQERISILNSQESALQARCAGLVEELGRVEEEARRQAAAHIHAERSLAELMDRERATAEQARLRQKQLEEAHAETRRELERERKERDQAQQLLDELGDAVEQEKQKCLYWEQQSSKTTISLKEATQRIASLSEQIATIESQCAAIADQSRSANEALDREIRAHAEADLALAELGRKERATADELNAVRNELLADHVQVACLRDELQKQQSAGAELTRGVDQARAEAAELMENLAAAELDKVALQDRVLESASAEQDARSRVAVVEAALAEAQTEVARLDADLVQSLGREERLSGKCADAERLSGELQTAVETGRQQARQSAARIEQLETCLQASMAGSARLQDKCSALQQELDKLEHQCRAHRSESDQEKALRCLAEARHSESAAAQARLEHELAAETQARARLRQQLSIAHRRLRMLAEVSSTTERNRTVAERQLAQARAQLSDAGRQNTHLDQRIRTAETDRTILTERVARFEILLGEALAARAHMEAQNAELAGASKVLAEKLAIVEAREQTVEESRRHARASLEDQARQVEALKSAAAVAESEREILRSRLADAECEARKAADAIESRLHLEAELKRREVDVTETLRLQREEFEQLSSAMATCQSSAEAAQLRIRELLQMQTSLCRRVAERDKNTPANL